MTGESRSMEQNVLERSGLMKDFLSEKINGLKRERLKEIREKFESNVGNVRKQFESVLGAITSEAEQEIIVILILSILVDTFISKISFPMQPGPEIGSISDA